ncbi:hypothetical protein CRE_15058 [Caenorhabditis remanei]|uniref:F-box domain-containing protein n=1 Tax=Caenorhabditis remanei TaxID=31234 RepID=E3NME6_CAERE|nr:hypothetical protein CRE_15058 [Caenorhabditis remanei]
MSSTPFPLFSLPYLPLKQVFDNFGPHGIINLSLCSQKSRNMAISYRGPSKDIKIEIHFGRKEKKDCILYSSNFEEHWLLSVSEITKVYRKLDTVRIGNFEKRDFQLRWSENGYLKNPIGRDRIVGDVYTWRYISRHVFNARYPSIAP